MNPDPKWDPSLANDAATALVGQVNITGQTDQNDGTPLRYIKDECYLTVYPTRLTFH